VVELIIQQSSARACNRHSRSSA